MGQAKDKLPEKDAPTLVRFELTNPPKIYHMEGTASAGFIADAYFEPVNVSFVNIVWEEEKCKPSVAGAYDVVEWADKEHPETRQWIEPVAGAAGKGTNVGDTNRVTSGKLDNS